MEVIEVVIKMESTKTLFSANLSKVTEYFKRDALAGTVTGVMAVPLTVGICLMSDYPVMVGLHTVIFACIISFVSTLVKPGNYVGTPGVAAGLAPALALGVSTFGMENMPFVIFLTATFQAIAWKFKLERYILRLVPHHLVEGLLAGVGIKIGLKFVPFLYNTVTEGTSFLTPNRALVVGISVVSLGLFVYLYKKFQKEMPAIPYFVIMLIGVGLSFVISLPMLTIDPVPFSIRLPLPNFASIDALLIVKMIGFALMLGSIDVIEQVMSNVAIEKLDPLDRKCDSNNSLFCIWIANMGATFFGGMTNLDGLAKSTTNATAGAVTKLSNLFTAFVLLMVVLFPAVLLYIPKFALGIIMVYSGWKMVSNLGHVKAQGKYALLEAAICALVVFKLGIFEGLLIMLVIHAVIHLMFSGRMSKKDGKLLTEFIKLFRDKEHEAISQKSTLTPVWDRWVEALNSHDVNALVDLYDENAVFAPEFSTRIRNSSELIKDYYKDLFDKDDVFVSVLNLDSKVSETKKIDSGTIGVGWREHGIEKTHVMRFSAVIENGKILAHHGSILPSGDVSIALYSEQKEDASKFIF
jgi:MFS superfamily sulfate permease-like transporter